MIDLDWQGKVRALWRALDSLQEGGFSLDPRDLAHNVAALWAAINRVAEIATDPPPGEPAAIEAAAERWRSLADALDVRAAGLEALVRGLPEGWRGAVGRDQPRRGDRHRPAARCTGRDRGRRRAMAEPR